MSEMGSPRALHNAAFKLCASKQFTVDVSSDKNSTEQASQMFYIMQPFQT